jgi:hypothetical protein
LIFHLISGDDLRCDNVELDIAHGRGAKVVTGLCSNRSLSILSDRSPVISESAARKVAAVDRDCTKIEGNPSASLFDGTIID